MKTEPKIALEEWLAELQRLGDRSDEGLTAHEWAEAMGVEHECALRRLNKAKAAGWLKVGRRKVVKLDGVAGLIPVYQIINPKGGKR